MMDEQTNVPGEVGGESGKRVPFQHFVETRRAGKSLNGYAPPGIPGARGRRSPARIGSAVVMLALVVGGMIILSRSAQESGGAAGGPGTERSAGGVSPGGSAPKPPKSVVPSMVDALGFVATDPEVKKALEAQDAPAEEPSTPVPDIPKQVLKAGQYTDPADDRPPGPRTPGVLHKGDYVTVIPYVRGWDFLYFVVLGTNDRLHLSRIYPRQMLRGSPPPLKFTAKTDRTGTFQVMLIGSMADLADLQTVLVRINQIQAGAKTREVRLQKLIDDLTASLKADSWTYKLLEPLSYVP